MKDFKKKVTRPRKRVIAILLSALMVLSVVLPSGGSGVRYNAFAEGDESALAEGVEIATSGDALSESFEEDTVSTTEETTEGLSSEEEVSLEEKPVLESEITTEELVENVDLLEGGESTTNDITSFLSGVDLYNTNDLNHPLTVTWQVDSDSTYRMHINFAEDGTETKQFVMDTDNRTFRYTLPAGVTISQAYSPLKITLDDSTVLEGTVYGYEMVGDSYVITGTFEDNTSLKSAKNVKFYLDFDVQFDDDVSNLNFGNGVNIPVNVDNDSHITVGKSSSLDLANGKIKYTINVQSKKANNNIHIFFRNSQYNIKNVAIIKIFI